MADLITSAEIGFTFMTENFGDLIGTTEQEYFAARDRIASCLAQINQNAVQAAADAAVTAEQYTDPTYNGVDLASHYPQTIGQGGLCYKIETGDRVYLQDCVPGADGWQLLTPENIAATMEAHRQELAADKARAEILTQLDALVRADG